MARMRRPHQEDVKAKIKTTLLLGRLHQHAMGELELSSTQVKSIEILINKTLSDAPKQVEMDTEIRDYTVSGEPKTADEWNKTYSLAAASGAAEGTH